MSERWEMTLGGEKELKETVERLDPSRRPPQKVLAAYWTKVVQPTLRKVFGDRGSRVIRNIRFRDLILNFPFPVSPAQAERFQKKLAEETERYMKESMELVSPGWDEATEQRLGRIR